MRDFPAREAETLLSALQALETQADLNWLTM